MDNHAELLPGLMIDSEGQATVSPSMSDLLFDLAIALDDEMPEPVDIQHVLAALVLAVRAAEIDRQTRLAADNPRLLRVIQTHLQTVFGQYGGQPGQEELE